MRYIQILSSWASCPLAIALVVTPTYGQAVSQDFVLTATDPRPLDKIAEQFERRYGIPVSYEDAAYSYSGDLIDQINPDYKKAHPDATALAPKGGPVELRVRAGTKIGTSSDAVIPLQAALDGHVRAGNPGEFKLWQIGDGIVIAPARVRGLSGALQADQSPLDVAISVPEMQRSAVAMLEAICSAITAASRKRVVVGNTPFTGIGRQVVIVGARNETARSVLLRMLTGLQWSDPQVKAPILKMSWHLLYGPDDKTYVLNVRQTMVETSSLSGRRVLQPVTQ